MSLITKDTFVSATFIDQDRKNLEVLLNMDHTGEMELTPHVIEASEEQKDFKDLMKITTMDAIHEETWNIKKAESEAFVAMAKQVMADSGMLEQESNLSKTKIFPTLVEAIFTNMENEDHLFALKLALFELQEIRESDNVEAKTALRKAQHKIEILQHAFAITGVRSMDTDVVAELDPKENEKALDKVEATIKKESKMSPKNRAATAKRPEVQKAKVAAAKKIAAAKGTEA
jgi:hypothetical protein